MQTWGEIMRKLFHTTAALSILVGTSMAANAADVRAACSVCTSASGLCASAVQLDGILSWRQYWGCLGSS
jgi:hypothetical protein